MTVAGWGDTNSGVLQNLPDDLQYNPDVDVIATSTCNARLGYNGAILDGMICIGTMAGGEDTCQVRFQLYRQVCRSCIGVGYIFPRVTYYSIRCHIACLMVVPYMVNITGIALSNRDLYSLAYIVHAVKSLYIDVLCISG